MSVQLYKHVNNTEVAFEILKQYYVKKKQLYKLHVVWWNVGCCHEPWCMQIKQKLEIKKADWQKWKLYEHKKTT